MAFLNDKILYGKHVVLRHVTPDDAEAILAAWHSEPVNQTDTSKLASDARILLARAIMLMAERVHPFAKAKFCGPQVSSTWRHHRPPGLKDEREILRRFENDEDRYQYLITRKESSEIVGCIGFKTNRTTEDGLTDDPLENTRVAKLGMLLFREDPWDHVCEKEAITLLLDTIFEQTFRKRDDTTFRIMDVVIPVNMDDELALGFLLRLGFRASAKSYTYHGRLTQLLEYFPPDLDPKKC